MFSKLKEKLKSWTEKLSKDKETEEILEEPVKETKAKEKKKTEPKKEKVGKKVKVKEDKKKKKEIEKTEVTKEIKKPEIEIEVEEEEIEEEILPPKAPEEYEKEKAIEPKETKLPKKSFFSKLISKTTTISEEEFDKYKDDLEYALLENNVAFEVVDKIITELKNKLIEKEILKNNIENEINEILKEIIKEVLIEPFDLIKEIKNSKKPYVILFCGINGSGKTTTIAKVAHKLKKEKISCVLAGADTFRSAAIEQIKKHGENLGIKVISHEYNSDPASVGFDAIRYAEKNNIDVVLIDTAGRIHTDKNLMNQIEKVARVCKPNAKIFIGESITGNDSVEQVKAFDKAVSIDGIILTKADVDEKGGTALSVGYVTGKPILYLGVGQEYEKLEKFDKDKFVERLGL